MQLEQLEKILSDWQKLPTLRSALSDIHISIASKGVLTRILWNKYTRTITIYPLRYMGEPESSIENDFKYTLLHIFCPIRKSEEFKKLCGMFRVGNMDPTGKHNALFEMWWRKKVGLIWANRIYNLQNSEISGIG